MAESNQSITSLLDKYLKQVEQHPEWVPELGDIVYVVHGTGSDRDRVFTLDDIRTVLQTVFKTLHLEDDDATTDIEPAKITMCDDEESDYRTELLLDLLGSAQKGYGAMLELSKQYDGSTIKKLEILLGLAGTDLSQIKFDGEVKVDDVKTPIVKSVEDIDGTTHVTGYQVSDELLMLAKVYNNQGAQAYKRFRLKWDDSAKRFNLDYDGNISVNSFMYLLDNNRVFISPLYNPATGATNVKGLLLNWDSNQNRFDARLDGDLEVNGNLNGRVNLDALIVSPSNDNWQKETEWSAAGQSKRVLNNTSTDMSVTYFPSTKQGSAWQAESTTKIITIPPYQYRTFTWTGAVRNEGGVGIAAFIIG